MSDKQIDIHKTEDLFRKAKEIMKLNEQEWRKSGKYFNVFSTLGIERKEVRHSALLAAFLDPNGFHGMSDCFIKELLCRIEFETFPTKDAVVRTEEVIRGGKRLDISIVSKDGKQKIVIENKIDTEDHDNQLSEYLKDLRNKESYKLIYLTLNGDEPTENIKDQKEDEIVCLSYKNDILQILENVSSAKNMLPHPVLEIIRQYILTIKNITNQGVDKQMNKELKELLLQENNLGLVEELSKQIEPLKIQILTSFLTLLKQKFESNKHKVEISENAPEKAARKFITSKNSWINLNISLESGKKFKLQFVADLDEIWQTIENDAENTKKLNNVSTGIDFKPLFIKFKSPNDGFKTFAKMNDSERVKYISDYVGDIEARLKSLNL